MLDNLLAQWRNTPRLRWGTALIVGIGWLYGVLLLHDSLQEQTRQHRALVQSIARLSDQAAHPEWASRALAARTLSAQLQGSLWQAATPGLAQAALQDWLNASLIHSDISKSQVTVTIQEDAPANAANPSAGNAYSTTPSAPDQAPALPADLWKLKAKLSFDFNAASLTDFLSTLETHDKHVVIGQLVARKEPPRVDLELYAYFQKPANALVPQATAAAAPAKTTPQ